jgi:hypothetical protein
MTPMSAYSGKLQKFYRQPKIYISLPSKGEFYPKDGINGDPTNLPVYGMTAMDEIMFKTPDALFSGEAVVSVIKSCVPGILDPWQMPQIDLDTILIAIRMATYSDSIEVNLNCDGCETEWTMDFPLQPLLGYFSELVFQKNVTIDVLTFELRPMTYKERTNLQVEAYKIQKSLTEFARNLTDGNITGADKFYKALGKLNAESMRQQIVSISADEDVVANEQEISDFLNNSEKMFYDGLRNHTDEIKELWKIPKQTTVCPSCGLEQYNTIDLDNSNFFVKS